MPSRQEKQKKTLRKTKNKDVPLTQHLLDHMRLLPLVAQQVCWDARENNAGADQALERSGPKGHDDHEDAAQNKSHGDEQTHLQTRNQEGGRFVPEKGNWNIKYESAIWRLDE